MKRLIIPFIVILLSAFTVSAQWTWQYPVPQGNKLNDITFDPSGDIGFAVGNIGVILKSEDHGRSWFELDSVTTENLNAVDYVNGSLSYAVGNNGIILKTTDNTTWTKEESNAFYDLFGVGFINESKGFAVGYKGLILKYDNGTWSEHLSGIYRTFYGVGFATSQIGVIVGDSGTIFRTTNGGDTWNKLDLIFNNALNDVYFTSATTGYIAGNGGLILKTTNAGETWTNISYIQVQNNLYGVHFADDSSGYVCGANGMMLYTLNGGDNWIYRAINTSLSYNSIYQLDKAHDTVCDTVIMCGDNGVIIRTDSCTTMSNVTASNGQALNTVVFLDDTLGYAVGGNLFNNIPLVLKTTDGENWAPFSDDAIKQYLTDIYFLNRDTAYITAKNGKIYRSDSLGLNWSLLQTGVTKTLYSVCFYEQYKGFAVGADGTVIKTTEADTTWKKLSAGTTKSLYSIYYRDSIFGGYAVGDEGIVLRLKEDGEVITKINSGTSVPLYHIAFPTDSVGFIVGYNGRIFKIRHMADKDTIISLVSGVTTPLNEVFFPSPDTGYITGEGGVILKSTDGGDSWYPQYTGTDNNLRGIFFQSSTMGYTVGSGPTVLVTHNGGGGVIYPSSVPEIKTEARNLRLFPNPASGQVWVEYELIQNSRVTVSIFDLSGRQIAAVLNREQNAGLIKQQINISQLQKGIYILVLRAGHQRYAEKLIIMH